MYFLLKVILVFYICTHDVQAGLLQNIEFPANCLRVKGSSKNNNADLDIFSCNESAANQQLNVDDWALYGSKPGKIVFEFNKKCVTVKGGGVTNGDIVNQYDCVPGSQNQLWRLLGTHFGNFQLQNVGSSKCLTAEEDGNIDQTECIEEYAGPNQFWTIYDS